MYGIDFDDLITQDSAWWNRFRFLIEGLTDEQPGQLVFWPVDDFLQRRPRYVPCPARGTHLTITECWMCHGDWAYGHATLAELVSRAGEPD